MTDTCFCAECGEDKEIISTYVSHVGVISYTLVCTHTMTWRMMDNGPDEI